MHRRKRRIVVSFTRILRGLFARPRLAHALGELG